MRHATPLILTAMLFVPVADGQETTSTTSTAATTTTAALAEGEAAAVKVPVQSSIETRAEFNAIIRRNSHELGRLLALEPSLLNNKEFLATYPELAEYIEHHPEVRLRPHFYLGDFQPLPHRGGPLDDLTEPLITLIAMGFVAYALGWLLRTWIEQRRWNRQSRIQTEVHTKILDRFGTSTELLEYVKSPAGTKFLESAPIPLAPEKPAVNAPHSRALWSIQIGIVVAMAALGMLIVSMNFQDAEELLALGAIALSIGAGFILSAVVSLYLSRRLATWQDSPAAHIDDAGSVR